MYQLELTSEATVAPGATPLTINVSGELSLSVVNAAPVVDVLGELRDLRVQGNGSQGTADTGQLTRELADLWGFELNHGRLERLHLRGSASGFAVSIVTTVAAAFQYRPSESPSGTWTTEETDASGRYDALYQLGASPGDVTKSKQRYLNVELPSAMPLATPLDLTPKIVASSGLLNVEHGRLMHIRSHEELQVALTSTGALRSKTDVKLRETQFEPAPVEPGWQQLLASTVTLTPGRALATDRSQPQFDETRIGNYTFESALQELQTENPGNGPLGGTQNLDATKQEQIIRDQSRVFMAMTAILRSRPQDVKRAVTAIERGSPASKALLDALGSASTAQSEQALATIMQNASLGTTVRREAAFALIRTPYPTQDAVQVLLKNIKDKTFRVFALYGLGSFARRLRESGAVALSNQASEALLTQLGDSKQSDRVDVLRGIANSGYSPALPRVRPLLMNADASIRTAAVQALQLMPGPEVESLIAERINPDENRNVRLAALDAAGARESSDKLVAAVKQAAINAPDSQSRARAVRVMERWLPKCPELRASLQQVAWSDSREGVRKLAQASLSAGK